MKPNLLQKRLVAKSYLFCLSMICIYFLFAFIRIAGAYDDARKYIENAFNAIGFHWLISSTYLYWIFKNDYRYYHTLSRIRFVTTSRLYLNRWGALVVDTASYMAPFCGFAILLALFLGNQTIIFIILQGLCNLTLGVLLIGAAVTALNFIQYRYILNYLIIYILLTIDIFSGIGWLSFDTNIVYNQALSIQLYLVGIEEPAWKMLLAFAVLFVKVLLVFTAGYFTKKVKISVLKGQAGNE